MKKITVALISTILIAMLISSCGGKKDDGVNKDITLPQIDPVSLLPANDVYTALDYAYVPEVDGGVIVNEGNTSTAVYVSNPKGEHDSVEISVTQKTDAISADTIKAYYNESIQKRADAILVSNLGEIAYIAYPSIYVYDTGCIIKITAGSGADVNQQNLLINLATTALGNFDKLVEEAKGEK